MSMFSMQHQIEAKGFREERESGFRSGHGCRKKGKIRHAASRSILDCFGTAMR
jgi:hypothetical protein